MYRSQRLNDAHDVGSLASGEPTLDVWFHRHAREADKRNLSRIFVWVDEQDAVVAYYSLSGNILRMDGLPPKIAKGLPDEVAAVLLGRLALDRSLHGKGLGGALLADALGRAVLATEQVAARFVVVDALNDSVAQFYERYGFTRIPATKRLVMRLSDVAASATTAATR